VGGITNKVLVVIVFSTFGFFTWNFSEFFSPDAIYYFGRRLDSLSDLASAFFSLDDRGQYRPLGLVLFSFVFHPLLGSGTAGYHLIPLLFHAANIFLVYRIARELHADSTVALSAAFFFALHRCNFFITFGITFLPDFAGCFFFLSAFLVYMKRRGAGGWISALVLFVLGLGNKETVVVFPAVLLCYEWFRAGRPGGERRWTALLKPVLPFLAVSVLFTAFMFYLRGNLYPDDTNHPYRASLAVGSLIPKVKYFWWAVNLPQGSGLADLMLPGLVRSASMPKIGVPYPLPTLAATVFMLPIALALCAAVVSGLRRRDRFVILGLASFLLALAPVLPLAGKVMQHNLYFSVFGLSLLFGVFVRRILETRWKFIVPSIVLAYMFSTGVGIANNRHISWPVTSARTSKQLLERFTDAARSQRFCESGHILIARTGNPDFVWYSDGGNLFRVFGPCPEIKVYFEDLGQTARNPDVVRLELE